MHRSTQRYLCALLSPARTWVPLPRRYTPYAHFRAAQQSLPHDGDDLAAFLE